MQPAPFLWFISKFFLKIICRYVNRFSLFFIPHLLPLNQRLCKCLLFLSTLTDSQCRLCLGKLGKCIKELPILLTVPFRLFCKFCQCRFICNNSYIIM